MTLSVSQISQEVRTLYRRTTGSASEEIEAYLENTLAEMGHQEKRAYLENVSRQFRDDVGQQPDTIGGQQMARFISLLLGRDVAPQEVGQRQLQENLCKSLNAVFDSLNRLIQAINDTLNRNVPLEETIRYIIHKDLEHHHIEGSLEEYIDQIRKSFISSYDSSKTAHVSMMNTVLEELKPENFLSKTTGNLNFGPLKKAQAFDQYTGMYRTLYEWHESGRGLDEYIRTFEKQCSESTHHNKEVGP